MSDRLVDVWVLLSDTDRFVSRARLMKKFEGQLRTWRQDLHQCKSNPERTREIRNEIITFRRTRREEGWELRLGSLDVQLKGFRNDDALSCGFLRMVLLLGENGDVRYITGTANHIELDRELNVRLGKSFQPVPLEPHYLWYRRMEGILELAGADSQSLKSQEMLKKYVMKHKSVLIRAMHKLH